MIAKGGIVFNRLAVKIDLAVPNQGGFTVARKTVLVSDLSGKEISENDGAKVRITYADARRGAIELDVTAEEAKEMGAKGRQVARRGRKPKSS
jgi:hypothetical protein